MTSKRQTPQSGYIGQDLSGRMTQTRQNVDTGARCRIAFLVTDAHIHIEEDF